MSYILKFCSMIHTYSSCKADHINRQGTLPANWTVPFSLLTKMPLWSACLRFIHLPAAKGVHHTRYIYVTQYTTPWASGANMVIEYKYVHERTYVKDDDLVNWGHCYCFKLLSEPFCGSIHFQRPLVYPSTSYLPVAKRRNTPLNAHT